MLGIVALTGKISDIPVLLAMNTSCIIFGWVRKEHPEYKLATIGYVVAFILIILWAIAFVTSLIILFVAMLQL